jgi:hypothetical protein
MTTTNATVAAVIALTTNVIDAAISELGCAAADGGCYPEINAVANRLEAQTGRTDLATLLRWTAIVADRCIELDSQDDNQ